MSTPGTHRQALSLSTALVAFAAVAGAGRYVQAQPLPEGSPDNSNLPAYPQVAPDEQGAGDPAQAGYADEAPPQDWSQQPENADAQGGDQGGDASGGAPLIPPNAEGPAYPASDGNYCYVGPHPVDTRVVPGSSWDDTQGQHLRPYPPIDTRLFAYRDGCYYFTGDPRDFGFGGQTYAYYGAHPILDGYGGGWCFMMGPHTHIWQPWSPNFTVVGSWYYWHGPFDPFFWAYWPYYSFYYRSYYPSYYGGGRFYRGGGWRTPPPIRPVQVRAWRGNTLRGAPVYRGAPGVGQAGRGIGAPGGVYRGYGSPAGRPASAPVGPAPGFHPGAPGYGHPAGPMAPSYRQVAPSMHPGGGSPGYHPAAPAFHPAAPSFHPAPAGGGFRGGGGGGFRRR